MNLIDFPERTVIYAKDQPQYQQLPAHQFKDAEGRIACCWSLSWRERIRVLFTGRIWHQILTFGKPLQPQLLTAEKPAMPGSVGEARFVPADHGRFAESLYRESIRILDAIDQNERITSGRPGKNAAEAEVRLSAIRLYQVVDEYRAALMRPFEASR